MFGLALLFVFVFLLSPCLGSGGVGKGAGLCAYRDLFVGCARVGLCRFFSSSCCRGLSAASACDSSRIFLLIFLFLLKFMLKVTIDIYPFLDGDIPRATFYGVYIYHSLFDLLECLVMSLTLTLEINF